MKACIINQIENYRWKVKLMNVFNKRVIFFGTLIIIILGGYVGVSIIIKKMIG